MVAFPGQLLPVSGPKTAAASTVSPARTSRLGWTANCTARIDRLQKVVKCHLGDALGIDGAVVMYLAVLVRSSLQHATAQKRRRTCQPCGLLFLKLAYQLRDAAGEGGP